MGRHLPGNPAIIVDNMTGAGSRVAANYLFKATPDGLVIGNFIDSLLLQQILGDKGIEFDGRKFEWLQLIEGFKGTSNIRVARRPFAHRLQRHTQRPGAYRRDEKNRNWRSIR